MSSKKQFELPRRRFLALAAGLSSAKLILSHEEAEANSGLSSCSTISYPADIESSKKMKMSNPNWSYNMRAMNELDAKILQEQALNSHNSKAADELLRQIRSLSLIQTSGANLFLESVKTASLAKNDLLKSDPRFHQWVAACLCVNVGNLFAPANSLRFAAETLKSYVDEHVYFVLRLYPFFKKDSHLFLQYLVPMRSEIWYDEELERDTVRFSKWIEKGKVDPRAGALAFETLAQSLKSLMQISPAHVVKTKLLRVGSFKIKPESMRPADDFNKFVSEILE